MHSMINGLLDLPQYKLYIGLLVIGQIIALTTSILLYFVSGESKEDNEDKDKEVEEALNMSLKDTLIEFLETSIVTAYIETILIQWAIFRLVGLVLRGNPNASIIAFFIATFVFAGLHIIGRKWYHIFIHLPISISLALIFMLNDINHGRPILYTFLFHGIWNTIAAIGIPSIVRLINFIKNKVSLLKTNYN